MLDIYFESDQEVIQFCENLFRYNKEIELSWKTHEDWGNHLHFADHVLSEHTIHAIGKSMVNVFIKSRLSKMIKHIIKEDYYYSNVDEIERILNLAYGIINDENEMQRKERQAESIHELIHKIFLTNMEKAKVVHFDSVIKFRLKYFRERLLEYIGLAIDEFKQEEDHQNFIDMLRKYITKKEPLFEEIHILQGDDFTFYKSTGKQLSNLELRTIIFKEPLYIVGLDIEELNLAPLIAIAPKRIKIYGDNPTEPKTVTVINVFQEKVIFESIHHFPFTETNT